MGPFARQPECALYAEFALRHANFELHAHLEIGAEILVLFGPSGSGKTTTLNAIAGLITPEHGQIALHGEVLFHRDGDGRTVNVPARSRHIGYVFQHYALFPHLTAAENVAYGLRGAGGRARAMELLDRMGLAHLAGQYPRHLSGGQQQRVAIARAVAGEPRMLLLDEPFSALDVSARQRLQGELLALQRELGLPMVYVTHRLEDAFAVGQRLAIMRDGRVEQVGPIEEVFRRPANAQVAGIMGIANLFRAEVVAVDVSGVALDWDGMLLHAPAQDVEPGSTVTAYIRPEDVKILYPDRPLTDAVHFNQVTGTIVEAQLLPGARRLRVALDNGHEIDVSYAAYAYAPLSLQVGEPARLALRRDALVLLQ
jgi:molybdate transport system ATP-binding protein